MLTNKLIVFLNENFDNYFRKWVETKAYSTDYTNEKEKENALTDFFYSNYGDIIDIVWNDVEEVLYDRCEEILKKDGLIK